MPEPDFTDAEKAEIRTRLKAPDWGAILSPLVAWVLRAGTAAMIAYFGLNIQEKSNDLHNTTKAVLTQAKENAEEVKKVDVNVRGVAKNVAPKEEQ